MVLNSNVCNLNAYRKGGCQSCSNLCPHKISLHGLNDNGGRTKMAGIPSDYTHVTFENSPARESQSHLYEKVLPAYIKTFVRHLNGGERTKSLYLWSERAGTGKTTTAVMLLNEWINTEYLNAIKNGEQPPEVSGAFLDINAFQSKYNLATMSNDDETLKGIAQSIGEYSRKEFLVIDDIGVRKSTEAFRGYIHDIINYRTVNRLPTVYTSNLPITEMIGVFDERLYDRMRDQCVSFEFIGGSKRGIR